MTLFSKSPYLTAHNEINYEPGCIGRFSVGKKGIQDHCNSKDGALCGISSFQPPANFTKSPNVGAMGFLNVPLEYYNVF